MILKGLKSLRTMLKVFTYFISLVICNCIDFILFVLNDLDTKPNSWVDEKGVIHGVFKEILEIATKQLNLTLVMKPTQSQNHNIWFNQERKKTLIK